MYGGYLIGTSSTTREPAARGSRRHRAQPAWGVGKATTSLTSRSSTRCLAGEPGRPLGRPRSGLTREKRVPLYLLRTPARSQLVAHHGPRVIVLHKSGVSTQPATTPASWSGGRRAIVACDDDPAIGAGDARVLAGDVAKRRFAASELAAPSSIPAGAARATKRACRR